LYKRSASRATMRSRPESNFDSEDEERKSAWAVVCRCVWFCAGGLSGVGVHTEADWASQTGSLGKTQGRPQSAARSRRPIPPPAAPISHPQQQKPVTHTYFPPHGGVSKTPIASAHVPPPPANPKYNHVKSRVYQPVEPRGRQMVTQYQVVVGSDEPVVKVRTESSPNGRRVGAAHAAGRSQSRSHLRRESSDSVKDVSHQDVTQLAPEQLARELQLAREAQARFAELARVEAERRKQSEEALLRLQTELSRSSLNGSVASSAVMEDLQTTVSKSECALLMGSLALEVVVPHCWRFSLCWRQFAII
jgi:hypothetical protein